MSAIVNTAKFFGFVALVVGMIHLCEYWDEVREKCVGIKPITNSTNDDATDIEEGKVKSNITRPVQRELIWSESMQRRVAYREEVRREAAAVAGIAEIQSTLNVKNASDDCPRKASKHYQGSSPDAIKKN
jgi:hypothetical protein